MLSAQLPTCVNLLMYFQKTQEEIGKIPFELLNKGKKTHTMKKLNAIACFAAFSKGGPYNE
jgi:hypothetical protein